MNALLRFTVENFRSIAERKSIKFTPDSIKDEPKGNVYEENGYNYLKTVAIYGANSSGKSNLIRAVHCMSSIVVDSVKVNKQDKLPYKPFCLNKSWTGKPTLYEIDAIINDVRYRYMFSNTEDRICDEQLVRIEGNGSEKVLFIRNIDGIGVNEKLFSEGKDLEKRTNDNRLFISLVGQLGGKVSNEVLNYFDSTINTLSGLETTNYSSFTKRMLHERLPGCDDMKDFFMRIQLGFLDVQTKSHDFDPNDIPENLPKDFKEQIIKELSGKKMIQVFSMHKMYSDNGEAFGSSPFDFEDMESAGTQKLFDIAGPIFDTLKRGSILIIDELDAKMHPLISQEMVSLFNENKRNPNGAQLIFTTHETNLLSSRLLRRDQIWFTEKDQYEHTDIYSMHNIVLPDGTKPRGDGNIERNYIRGRYGAIPYIRPYEG